MMKIKNTPLSSNDAGFTLVELMVGMFVSLIIIGVSLTYLISASASFKINANDGYIQENSRFALTFISRVLRRGGSNSQIDLGFETSPVLTDLICSDGPVNNIACTSTSSGPNNSDRITIAYILADGLTCNGSDISTFYSPDNGERIVDELWVATDADGVNNLYCKSSLMTSDGVLVAQGGAPPIISGIDMMKFDYAVDTNDDFRADRYLTIDEIVAGNPVSGNSYEDSIRAIKVGLLVNSGLVGATENNTEDLVDRVYQIFGVESTALNDQVLRQIFSTTIQLPNAPEN